MQGIPLVASSPVRNDSPLNVYGFEVTSYQAPWKSMSEITELENGGYQMPSQMQEDLMNQVNDSQILLINIIL
jgi:insulin gene enhancer protein ISL-1